MAFVNGAWGRPRPKQPLSQFPGFWGTTPTGFQPTTSANGWSPGGFTPFKAPTTTPAGTYDPTLDAQLENAQKGYQYGTQDYETALTRGGNDYATALAALDLSKSRGAEDLKTSLSQALAGYDLSKKNSLADLATTHSRSLADLLFAHKNAQQDFGLQRGDIRREYTNLADTQGGALEASGTAEGGALAQALAKRTENQGRDIGRVDIQAGRESQAYKTNTSRANEDYSMGTSRVNDLYNLQRGQAQSAYDTNLSRLNQDYGINSTALGTQWSRQQQDLQAQQQRAGEQLGLFTGQVNALKAYQAGQSGMLPTAPANEFVAQSGPRQGQSYRVISHGGTIYHQYSNGQLVPIRRA